MTVPAVSLPWITWPAVPGLNSRDVLSLLAELDQFQWWSADQLIEHQFRQLQKAFEHAYLTIPLYREHFESAGLRCDRLLSPADWRKLPTITRKGIQVASQAMQSGQVDPSHGPLTKMMTSGSTGLPIVTVASGVVGLFWKAMTIRDHLWHGRDFTQKLAVIRQTPGTIAAAPHGQHLDNWGQATLGLITTGFCELLSVASSIEEQARWLEYHCPSYLLTYPSLLLELARYFKRIGRRLPSLKQLRSFGEVLDPRTRVACWDAFGVRVVDNYSAQEVGYIALQCPDHEHYHVMAEDLLVEILNEDGQPCQPGEVGKVVVTTLHSFAMPLFRYEIGDYAEVGLPCSCGRGLPVLTRILGRQRNLLVFPDGRRRWPSIELDPATAGSLPISQFQIIQRTLHDVEVKLVAYRPLTPDEEAMLRSHVVEWSGYPFNTTFTFVDAIPRSAGGKYEDFRSEVSDSFEPLNASRSD
jgi:phenylacetate-CoA ligase